MSEVSPLLLVAIGLLLALWTAGAGWVMLRASARAAQGESARKAARRLARMVEDAPAIPLLVRADGRIEAPDRLAGWFGLDQLPQYLSELAAGDGKGLSRDQVEHLAAAVKRTQRTAAHFAYSITPPGSRRGLALRGMLADPAVSPSGSALVWVFDFTESERELAQLRREAARAREDFTALVGLIEAAPMPMWFRGNDHKLRLVNAAYVAAVGASGPEAVVEEQIELVEETAGQTAAQVARRAAERRKPIERVVTATINGARRTPTCRSPRKASPATPSTSRTWRRSRARFAPSAMPSARCSTRFRSASRSSMPSGGSPSRTSLSIGSSTCPRAWSGRRPRSSTCCA
jgi:PAS domain-containing protein